MEWLERQQAMEHNHAMQNEVQCVDPPQQTCHQQMQMVAQSSALVVPANMASTRSHLLTTPPSQMGASMSRNARKMMTKNTHTF